MLSRADGGTSVLRDVESIPAQLGETLGRLLLKKTSPTRRGGEEPVDIRLIVTSHRLLDPQGHTASDLLTATRGLRIRAPSLRERPNDIVKLFEHFAPHTLLVPESKQLITEHAWPGNVEALRRFALRMRLL